MLFSNPRKETTITVCKSEGISPNKSGIINFKNAFIVFLEIKSYFYVHNN